MNEEIKTEFTQRFPHIQPYHGVKDGKDYTEDSDVWQWIDQKLKEAYLQGAKDAIEAVRNQINGKKFMYEHYWQGDDKERMCETCEEIVVKKTPCTKSKGYPIWKDFNDLEVEAQQFIDSLEKGE